jgi:hypothetical protein
MNDYELRRIIWNMILQLQNVRQTDDLSLKFNWQYIYLFAMKYKATDKVM